MGEVARGSRFKDAVVFEAEKLGVLLEEKVEIEVSYLQVVGCAIGDLKRKNKVYI